MENFKKDSLFAISLMLLLFATCFRDVLFLDGIRGFSFLIVIAVFFVSMLSFNSNTNFMVSEILPFSLLLIISLCSIISSGVNTNYQIFMMGLYYSYLFYFVYLCGRVASVTFDSFIKLCNGYLYILLVIVIIAVIQAILYISPPPEYPLAFLRNTPSVYPHPVYLFASISLAFALSLSLYSYNRDRRYLFISMFLFCAQFFTFSRKSLLAVVVILILYYFWETKIYNKWLQRLPVVILALILSFQFLSPFLYRFTFLINSYLSPGVSEPSARQLLLSRAFDIAVNNFPFGSGPGTFASAPAATHYSSLYFEYGLNTVFGLQPSSLLEGNVTYLMDSFWPHVLAEYGFIGLLLYVFIMVNPVRLLWKLRLNENSEHRFLANIVIFVNFAIISESMGGSYPSQLYFILVYSVISALSVSLLVKLREQSDG